MARKIGDNKNGAVLVAAVLMVVIAAVAALGVSVFTTERIALVDAIALSEKAFYLAQAGINGAVFSYRFHKQSGNGYFSLGLQQVDEDRHFVLSATEGNLLMVDTSASRIGGENCVILQEECEQACDIAWAPCYEQCNEDYLVCLAVCPSHPGQSCPRACQRQRDLVCFRTCDNGKDDCYNVCDSNFEICTDASQSQNEVNGVFLQNATNSRNITIDRMTVMWDNNRRLREVMIGGQLRWAGNSGSPAEIDLNPNVVLNGPQVPLTYPVDYIRFNNKMTGVGSVSLGFIMTDGTTKTVNAYPASSGNFHFSVTSAGQAEGSGVSRTIQATYYADPSQARVADYHEID